MLPPPLPPPPTPPLTLVYNPSRITSPGSILTPVTSQDLERFQRPDNALRRALGIPPSLLHPGPQSPSSATSSRKRSRDPDEDKDDMSPRKKIARDDVIVALHCTLSAPVPPSAVLTIICLFPAPTDNARPEVGVKQRQDSPIFGLKNFNNWVKSVLIHKFAHEPLQYSNTVPPSSRRALQGRVLDIGCGKGGDLQKWAKARVRDYVGVGEAFTLSALPSISNTQLHRYRDNIRKPSSRSMELAQRRPLRRVVLPARCLPLPTRECRVPPSRGALTAV